jgi:hypothetical protein
LPFYGPLVQKLSFIGDRGFGGEPTVYVIGGGVRQTGGELTVMLTTLGALFAVSAIAGLAWRWHVWTICCAAFYGITLTLFTGLFTNQGGVWTGYWGTLDYWFRPEAQINREPPYYYGILAGLYEFAPLAIIALGAAWLFARGPMRNRVALAFGAIGVALVILMPEAMPIVGEHRSAFVLIAAATAVLAMRLPAFTKFAAFWTVCAFFGFSAVEHKSPATAVHIALPLTLLAARLVNDAIATVRVPSLPRPSFRAYAAPRLAQGAIAAAFAVIAVVSLSIGLAASWGRRDVPQLAHSLAPRDGGDTPVDMLQASQTSPDVREIRDAIARAGAQSAEGTSIHVVLDTSYDFATPWLWYLRDYTNLELQDLRRPYDAPAGAIVLADARNRARVGGVETAAALTYTQRWSFPRSSYDARSAEAAAHAILAGAWLEYAGDRASIGQLRAFEGVAFFPRELSAALPAARQSDVLSTNIGPESER